MATIQIEVATDFENHMRPDVLWLEDPRYAEAFEDETEKAYIMTEFTKTDDGNGNQTDVPGFIQLRFERSNCILRVRGDPSINTETGEVFEESPTVQLKLEQAEWDQFVSWAIRDRGLVPYG